MFNPYYEVKLVIFDAQTGSMAITDNYTNICKKNYERIKSLLTDKPSARFQLGFLIDQVMELQGERHYKEKPEYLHLELGREKLPKSAAILTESPNWFEKIECQWHRAGWAFEQYAKLLNQK